MNQNRAQTYITKDLYVASFLVAQGEKYTISKNGDVVFFTFEHENPPTERYFEMMEEEYWSGNAMLSAKDLFTAYKELKTRVFMQLKK